MTPQFETATRQPAMRCRGRRAQTDGITGDTAPVRTGANPRAQRNERDELTAKPQRGRDPKGNPPEGHRDAIAPVGFSGFSRQIPLGSPRRP